MSSKSSDYYTAIKKLAYTRLHYYDEEMSVTTDTGTKQRWESEDNILDAVEEVADLINYLDFTKQRRDALSISEELAFASAERAIQTLAYALEVLDTAAPELRRGVRDRMVSRKKAGLLV